MVPSSFEADRLIVLRAYRTTLWRTGRLLAYIVGVMLALGFLVSWWSLALFAPAVVFVAGLWLTFWVQARWMRGPEESLDVHHLGDVRRTFERRGYPDVASALERCIDRRSIQLPSAPGRNLEDGT